MRTSLDGLLIKMRLKSGEVMVESPIEAYIDGIPIGYGHIDGMTKQVRLEYKPSIFEMTYKKCKTYLSNRV